MTPGSDFLWPEDEPELEVYDEVAPFGEEEFKRLLARDSFPPQMEPVNYKDGLRQTRCIKELADLRNCDFTESENPMEHWDAILSRGARHMAVVEFKGRNVGVMHYDGIAWFRENKIHWVMQAGQELGVPGIILVEYTDGLFWIRPEEVIEHGELTTTRGRGSTHDPAEVKAFKVGVARLHQLRPVEAEQPQMESPEPPMERPAEHNWLLD